MGKAHWKSQARFHNVFPQTPLLLGGLLGCLGSALPPPDPPKGALLCDLDNSSTVLWLASFFFG